MHLYIVTTLINYYKIDYRANSDFVTEQDIEEWYQLFDLYQIKIEKVKFDVELETLEWFNKNLILFEELFERLADEIFYLLFANRGFLLGFNNVISKTIQTTKFPQY